MEATASQVNAQLCSQFQHIIRNSHGTWTSEVKIIHSSKTKPELYLRPSTVYSRLIKKKP